VVGQDAVLRSGIFAGLSEEECRAVLRRGTARTLPGGTVLFRQDDPAEAFYVVEAGRVKLGQVGRDGGEVLVRISGPGEAFAAIAAIDGKAYPFTATTVGETRTVHWPRGVLRELFRELPRFQASVLAVVGTHSREMLDRFRELATETVPQRLARALLRLVPAEARDGVALEGLTQQDLAQICGTTLYTVSRTLSEWQADGVVETARGRVAILSFARLRQLAGE
jgi:CRP/FNR family transcriptional regulator, nitrogen oxide reductase regulator